MILTREQIKVWAGSYGDCGVSTADLIDTAWAYHDLRDAVLGLCDEWDNDEWDVPPRARDFRTLVESVGAR